MPQALLLSFKLLHLAFAIDCKPVHPSYQQLADMLGVHRNTAIKYTRLIDLYGAFEKIISGKRQKKANIYELRECYKNLILTSPIRPILPLNIWMKIQNNLKNKKLKKWWATIYEHISKDFVQYLIRKINNLRCFLKKEEFRKAKTAKDPPKHRKRPPRPVSWHELREFKLSSKDLNILGRYPQSHLHQAKCALKHYEEKGNLIENVPAFLTHVCKQLAEKERSLNAKGPTMLKEAILGHIQTNSSDFTIVGSAFNKESQDGKTQVQFLRHKNDKENIRIKVLKKVCGQWIDKIFFCDRPGLFADFVSFVS